MNKAAPHLLLALILAPGLLLPPAGAAETGQTGHLTLGAGVFEAFQGNNRAAEGYLAYRFAPRLFGDRFGPAFRGIGPMVGLNANSDGGVFGYGDLFLDIRPTENTVIWPSAGIGGYRRGNSVPLGGVFQFHAELFLGYRVTDNQMLGLSYQHISNAGIHASNPTADSFYLTYTLALW